MFQDAAKKAAFQQVHEEFGDSNLPDIGSLEGVNPEEFETIKKWANYLRYSMIAISTLMIITGYYNLNGATLAKGFLAFYLLMFSTLICCYEIALKRVSLIIVQNFGFMYSGQGRGLFILFVAVLCYQMSTLGIVCFALLLAYFCVLIYAYCSHPKLELYLRKLHYCEKVRPGSTESAV